MPTFLPWKRKEKLDLYSHAWSSLLNWNRNTKNNFTSYNQDYFCCDEICIGLTKLIFSLADTGLAFLELSKDKTINESVEWDSCYWMLKATATTTTLQGTLRRNFWDTYYRVTLIMTRFFFRWCSILCMLNWIVWISKNIYCELDKLGVINWCIIHVFHRHRQWDQGQIYLLPLTSSGCSNPRLEYTDWTILLLYFMIIAIIYRTQKCVFLIF